MEPSRLPRTHSQFQLDLPHESDTQNFEDYVKTLQETCDYTTKNPLSQSLFLYFVEGFKGLKMLTPRESDKASRVLLRLLINYFQEASGHIPFMQMGVKDYLKSVIEIFETLSAFLKGKFHSRYDVVALVRQMALCLPSYQSAIYNHLRNYLPIDANWQESACEVLYNVYFNLPSEKDNYSNTFAKQVTDLSYLFFPGTQAFILSYVRYHLLKGECLSAEMLDSLLGSAFPKSDVLQKPLSESVKPCLLCIFRSAPFINLELRLAIYHAKTIAKNYLLDAEANYVLCEALLNCANKEKIWRGNPKVEEIHCVTTADVHDLFKVYLNPKLTLNKTQFAEEKKQDLLKLFKRGFRIHETTCIREIEGLDDSHPIFFKRLITISEKVCHEFQLDRKMAMIYMKSQLFAGACILMQQKLRLDLTRNPSFFLNDLVIRKVSYVALCTILNLFKDIQSDPAFLAQYRGRIQEMLTAINGLRVVWAGKRVIVRADPMTLSLDAIPRKI